MQILLILNKFDIFYYKTHHFNSKSLFLNVRYNLLVILDEIQVLITMNLHIIKPLLTTSIAIISILLVAIAYHKYCSTSEAFS